MVKHMALCMMKLITRRYQTSGIQV